MTLSFSQQINGKPNYFVRKIWRSLKNSGADYVEYIFMHKFKFNAVFDGNFTRDFEPKIHTIRAGNRWKAGMKIHPVINNRTAERFQFAPVIECVSVQEIEIEYTIKKLTYLDAYADFIKITIDGNVFCEDSRTHLKIHLKLNDLAINDGFDNAIDFLEYFKPKFATDKPFKGQLIHWTSKKY